MAKSKCLMVLITLAIMFVLFHLHVGAAPIEGTPPAQSAARLVIGVVNDPPYLIKHDDGEWAGLNMDIWKAVAQIMNVDYELREMRFDEILDALRQKKIDLSIEAFYVTSEREKFMDFSFPFGTTRLAVATLPEKMHHPWWAALQVLFSWGILKIVISLGIVLCVLGFLFWVIERNQNPDHFGGGPIKGIGSGIYWVGSTLASGVCFGVALKSLTARLLGVIWMLACALALSALIASLSSTLTNTTTTVDVVNEEVLRHMHLAGIKGSAESVPLRNMGGKYTLYATETEMLNALVNGKVEGVLYDEITLTYYKVHDFKDKIVTYPTSFRRFQFAFGLPKDSPYRAKINYALLTGMEKPAWAYLLKRYGLGENFEEETFLKKKKARWQKDSL
jgi:polar amino acid transport system substrate-binding protein